LWREEGIEDYKQAMIEEGERKPGDRGRSTNIQRGESVRSWIGKTSCYFISNLGRSWWSGLKR